MSLVGDHVATVPDLTWTPRLGDPQDSRLWAAMLDARRRLSALADDPGKTQVFNVCAECLHRADAEAPASRYVAWDSLHQFDAEILMALDGPERHARWCMLVSEADEKLKGWRHEAAKALVSLVGDQVPAPHIVRELHANLVTASQNRQHKLELYQYQSLPSVGKLLWVAVGAAMSFELVVYSLKPAGLLPWAQALALGIPAGALGGILSTSFSLGRTDLSAKVPEMRLSRLVTLIRPMLGATVAIPIAVLVHSGYLKVAGLEGAPLILALCFLGGFSERWFLSLMERFEKEKT